MAQCVALTVDAKVSNTHAGDFGELLWPILLNVLQLIGAVCALVCLMRWDRAKELFVPRRDAAHRRGDPIDWFRKAYAVEMEQAISIDGRVVVRLCKLGFQFSAVGSFLGICLSLMYSYIGNSSRGTLAYTTSNLVVSDTPSWAVWCIVAAAYIYTAVFIWLMRAEWRYFIAMRHQHFARRARGDLGASAAQAQCSLMIERIPPQYRRAQELKRFFSSLFGGRIHSCILQRDTLMLYHLKALQATSEKASCLCKCCQASVEKNLERMVRLEQELVMRARQTESTFTGFALDGQVKAEDLVKLFKVRSVVEGGDESDDEVGASLGATSTGFVTLLRAGERAVSEQVVLFSISEGASSDDWVVLPAPEPRAIIWENVGTPYPQVQTRKRLGQIICFFGVLVWSVPVTGIQWFFSEAGLKSWAPGFLRFLRRHANPLYHIIMGYMPVLALLSLLILLPYILRILAVSFETRKSKTDVAQNVLMRNFFFQFFSLWLTVFSSSLLDSFKQIMHTPACSAFILGISIPKVSLYFTQFVIARIGISLPLLLIRIPAILSLLARTKPEPAYCIMETEITNIAIVFVIGSMYCVIAPVIMPACLIYFGLAFGIYKWLFTHVYETEFDCAGEMWYSVFNGLIIGMMFGMLSVCGIASIYAGASSSQFHTMWGAPLIIILFAIDCNKRLAPMSRVLPYQDAVEIDSAGVDTSSFTDDFYIDPIRKGDALPESKPSLAIPSDTDDFSDEETGEDATDESGTDSGKA